MILKNICGSLIVHDKKFIIVKESHGYMTGKWNLPGGHLEINESIFNAAIREAREETGLDIIIDGLVGIYQFKSEVGNNIIYSCFKASVKGGKLKHQKSELEEASWITFEDFLKIDRNKIGGEHLIAIINDYLKKGAIKNTVHVSGI